MAMGNDEEWRNRLPLLDEEKGSENEEHSSSRCPRTESTIHP